MSARSMSARSMSARSMSTRACRIMCTVACAATAARSAAGTPTPASSAGEHSSAPAIPASVNRLSAACRPRSIRLHVACETPARLAAYRMLQPRSRRLALIRSPIVMP